MRHINHKHFSQLIVIKTAIFTCFLIIFARLFFLQVIRYDFFQNKGQRNFIRLHQVPAPRGNIVDRSGQLLVTNRPVTNIYWKGSGLIKLTEKQKQTLQFIESTLSSESFSHFIPFSKIQQAEKYGKTIKIASDLTFLQISQIAEQCSDSQNVIFKNSFERFYPHKTTACHILGYLNNIKSGKMGLEHLFENSLQGEPGFISYIINAVGKELSIQSHQPEQSGGDIVTTLDLKLQQTAENLMPPETAGVFILIEPKTGAIRTLISRPDFDPTIFLKPFSKETWENIQKTKPFLNRAFDACYPPASPFKLITISAALETGLINQEDRFNCTGHIVFKGRRYYCNNHRGHGVLDVKDVVAHSCNIPCFKIAQKISIDTLAEYAEKFGLGSKTNIIFQEKSGIVPSKKWKITHRGEKWWAGETLSASIGQSFLLTTPIQIARMIGSIFTGNLVTPRIVEQTEIETKPLDIRPSTIKFLQECMKSVATTGTGRNLKYIKDITIYAKTGTAQTCTRLNDEQNNENKRSNDHAWFVSYFQYRDQDPLVMVILLEYVGSSSKATKIAQQFLKQYKIIINNKK